MTDKQTIKVAFSQEWGVVLEKFPIVAAAYMSMEAQLSLSLDPEAGKVVAKDVIEEARAAREYAEYLEWMKTHEVATLKYSSFIKLRPDMVSMAEEYRIQLMNCHKDFKREMNHAEGSYRAEYSAVQNYTSCMFPATLY